MKSLKTTSAGIVGLLIAIGGLAAVLKAGLDGDPETSINMEALVTATTVTFAAAANLFGFLSAKDEDNDESKPAPSNPPVL